MSFIYNRYKTAASNKAASIELRITYYGKQKYVSTGIKILPDQWKGGKIINHSNALHLNAFLDKMLGEVSQIIYNMGRNNCIDISRIPKMLKKDNQKLSFIEYCQQRIAVRKYGKTKDSQSRYDRFLRLFKEWGNIVYFEDITEYNIISYDQYLIKKGLKTYSKWNNYHRFLNSFILDAIDDGLLQRNPYKWISIEKGKDTYGISRCLSTQEFGKLKMCKLPTKSLERVRDLFVFQTYTCLSYSDLKDFQYSRITQVKGTKVYIGKRKKTHKDFTIPLLQPALEILNRYNGSLPVISNVKYNEYLKVVAQSAGIDKPVSSHWARHTGATLLLNEGVPMQVVSKICGHSSTRITEQVYAKLLDETVVDAVLKTR